MSGIPHNYLSGIPDNYLRLIKSQSLMQFFGNMSEDEIITTILDEAFYIHKTIGPGMLENVYKTCLAYRLQKRGLFVELEKPVPVFFEEVRMNCGYRADIVVDKRVIVDTKTIEGIGPLHVAQVLTYLRFLNLRYGLILNFNVLLLKDGIKRVIHGFGTQKHLNT